MSAPPQAERRSPTIRAVAEELGDRPVTTREIVEAIVQRHERDYVSGHIHQLTPDWPAVSQSRPFEDWLREIGGLWLDTGRDSLNGRSVILGAGICDPAAGRAMEASGLFHQLALELTGSFAEALSPRGAQSLVSLPLAAALAGVSKPGMLPASTPGEQVALSRDSRHVAGVAPNGAVSMWDVRTGVELPVYTPVGAPAPSVLGLSRDGAMLVFDVAGRLDLATAGRLLVLHNLIPAGAARIDGYDAAAAPADPRDISSCVFSDDGRTLAVARSGGSIDLFDVNSRTAKSSLRGHQGRISNLALRADRLISTADDGTARLWEVAGGSELAVFQHSGTKRVLSAALDGSGSQVATGDESGAVVLWDPANSSTPTASARHDGPVRALALSADGSILASGGDDGYVRLWRAEGLIEIGRLPHDGAQVLDVAFDPAGAELQSTASDGLARRWEIFVEPPLAPAYLADQVPDAPGQSWIDDDVDAFARLIASRQMSPPLSIAVFGDWGSGKTFFMRRLQRRVGWLADQARKSGLMQREVGYYKHVAQVEFNAWHYSGADLWASLVDTLFTQLWIEGDPQQATRERLEALFTDSRAADGTAVRASGMEVRWLEDEMAAAEKRAADVQRRADGLQAKLAEVGEREERAADAFARTLTKEAREALESAGYTELGFAPAEVVQTIRKARAAADDANILVAIVRARDGWWRLSLLLLAAILPVLVGLVIHALNVPLAGLRDLFGVAVGVGGAAVSIIAWLQRQWAWLRRQRAALAGTEHDAQAQLVLEAEKLEATRAATQEQLAKVESELAQARDRQRSASQRLDEREAEIRSGNPAALLARLIGDRAEGDYYRKHLGLLSLIRRDFEAISGFVEADRTLLESPSLTAADEAARDRRRISRIVLYIDDLDRCPPEVVVNVLEAIHLLLSFRLFVVVVGVDARWVSRALALRYPDLLPERRPADAASPLDYLEKIFQVPFWIEPMEAGQARQLIESLVGRRLSSTTAAAVGTNTQSTPPRVSNGAAQDGRSATEGGTAPAAQAAATAAPDLSPKTMELTGAEMKAVDAIAPLLAGSPRALKRFLNVYRLLRTKFYHDGFTEDRGPASDFRVAMFLLAVMTGQSDAAGVFFSEILGTSPGGSVLDAATKAAAAATRLDPVRDWLRQSQAQEWAELQAADLEGWAREVARYTFRPPLGRLRADSQTLSERV